MSNSSQRAPDREDVRTRPRCFDCTLDNEQFFCDLPAADRRELESIKMSRAFPKGSTLFVEGQPAHGVFMLCNGRVKLSTCSRDGRIMIIGVAAAGDVIGLSAAISGIEYEITAEAIDMCYVSFIPRDNFLRFLETHTAACLSAARQLGRRYQEAHQKLCAFGMSEPVLVKLAKLILGWSEHISPANSPMRLTNSFTHEEIAEMIGTSRETVTRTLREMRERGLVTLKGSDLVIHDLNSLSMTAGRYLHADV